MKTQTAADRSVLEPASLSGADRATLDAIFRHPSAHNLEWRDVLAMFRTLGEVAEKHNGEFAFTIGGEHHMMRKPRTKDLAGDDVIDLRRFLLKAGQSPDGLFQNPNSEVQAAANPAAPDLLVVVDHHGARIFHVDLTGEDPAAHVIKPYDPHHFLHHLEHKDQSRERGQRAPEDPSFYDRIAHALADAGKIVVVGHGEGNSNAAHHLTEYLRQHHAATHARIVREVTADLSSVTTPQLLDIARDALT